MPATAKPDLTLLAALSVTKRWSMSVLIIIASGFTLYTGATGPFESPVQRGFFILVLLPLVFLHTPSKLFKDPTTEIISAFALSLLTLVTMTWSLINFERLYSEPFIDPIDIFFGLLGLTLIIEAVRRTVGMAITLILIGFLIFAYFGESIPWRMLRHGGLDLETIASTIFYGTDGVFGTPVGVTATFIVMIMILGAFLTATGTSELFMNVAKSLAGRYTGGSAKIAVVGSALMGMITGATVANVATTGTVTIPMMKKAGYDARFAGAVEALASSGGQLMPPIMGAAAFVMIDYLNISYGTLVTHAIVPAILFFFSVLMIVHVRSVKEGFKPIPADQIPNPWLELKKRGHMLSPIVLLIVLLSMRYGIMYVAFFAVVTAMIICQLRAETRLNLMGYYRAFEAAMLGLIPLVAITAGAGILIGVLSATGLNLKITFLIEYIAQGSLLITLLLTMVACIILGMGLPTVAAYVVLATLVPGSLINLGISPIAAHLFIFYFAILSAITPPVCTGAYVAAGIAKADPVQTGMAAIRLGLVVFLLPFAFVIEPSLIMIGSYSDSAIYITTSVIGIVFWAYGLEGYYTKLLSPPVRTCLILAGAMLIWPNLWSSLAGLVLGGVILAPLFLQNRKREHA